MYEASPMSGKKSRSALAMQKLRETFRRTRGGPTLDSQLPSQQSLPSVSTAPSSIPTIETNVASLEVPKTTRSASFDEIRLKASSCLDGDDDGGNLLDVPSSRSQRSRSFDIATVSSSSNSSRSSNIEPTQSVATVAAATVASSLEVPRWRILRRASSDKNSSTQCIHCLYIEELVRQNQTMGSPTEKSFYVSSGSETNDSDSSQKEDLLVDDDDEELDDDAIDQDDLDDDAIIKCPVKVTLSVHGVNGGGPGADGGELTPPMVRVEQFPDCPGVTVVSLEVPMAASKQVRSASVDSSFLKVPTPDDEMAAGAKQHRSRSVDIVLPTADSGYVVRASKGSKKAIQGEIKISTQNGETRSLRSTPDWSEFAVNGDHLWVPTSASGDMCYVGENDCSKQGPRMKCPACKVIVHTGCINILVDKTKFECKETFKDVGIRQYREQTVNKHHWVHRRHQKGRCDQCGKSFQSKLSFGSKEIVAISCSWCKTAYHNKETCFSINRLEETCLLGTHANLIVPQSWIVKLPRKDSFKSSIRRPPKKRASTKRKAKKEGEKDQSRTFAIKPIPSANSKPLLVFINPKSGGNQGAKLMQKFQWLLNPRQVFDLSQGGPSAGLELYRKVPNLRILACGGDGTVGWLLSVFDQMGISPYPPIAILPLGTGNDLARSLGWGGGYTDEPISKILQNVQEGEVTQLDRWDLQVEPNSDADLATCEEGKANMPLNVVNNYFSLGVDAHIALEFHEAREAHPERFNSRLRNKVFYGQAGGKDLLQRKWKDLCNYVTLECDGVDLTMRLRELKVHSILFLNIPSYGGGTRPWGNVGSGLGMQKTDDGYIEVIGLTTYQLPFLQAGGHGTCLAQCCQAHLVTTRTIPMQVDGEPCKLLPSVIDMKLRNRANMMAKATKRRGPEPSMPLMEKLMLEVRRLNMADYENYHYDKEKLRELSIRLCQLCVSQDTYLEAVRGEINKLMEASHNTIANFTLHSLLFHVAFDNASLKDNFFSQWRHSEKVDTVSADTETTISAQKLSPDWCFLDSCTADRFFRIDKAQENLHYVMDICQEDLYILDPETPPGGIPDLVETTPLLGPSLDIPYDSGVDITASGLDSDSGCVDAAASCSKIRQESVSSTSSGPSDSSSSRSVLPRIEMPSNDIIVAAKTNNLTKLEELHSNGFSLLSQDHYGMTALHHASRCGFQETVQYLISNAPKSILDMPDYEKGQTALHKAAKYKQPLICCMLISAGASLSLVDKQGLTPRQLALQQGDDSLDTYLREQEVRQQSGRDKETRV